MNTSVKLTDGEKRQIRAMIEDAQKEDARKRTEIENDKRLWLLGIVIDDIMPIMTETDILQGFSDEFRANVFDVLRELVRLADATIALESDEQLTINKALEEYYDACAK
jgi:hypothetical protein